MVYLLFHGSQHVWWFYRREDNLHIIPTRWLWGVQLIDFLLSGHIVQTMKCFMKQKKIPWTELIYWSHFTSASQTDIPYQLHAAKVPSHVSKATLFIILLKYGRPDLRIVSKQKCREIALPKVFLHLLPVNRVCPISVCAPLRPSQAAAAVVKDHAYFHHSAFLSVITQDNTLGALAMQTPCWMDGC